MPDTRRAHLLTIRLSPAEYEQIRKLAAERGQPIAWMIRALVAAEAAKTTPGPR
jgi:predicted DNA-binding protein